MESVISNNLGSERSVEVLFIEEYVKKYYTPGNVVLDIGGIPTNSAHLSKFYNFLTENRVDYRVSDFRPCNYPGDFVQYDFKDEKFDMAIFLSSLEHFPQCTESDVVYRHGYDKLGYQKALSILKPGGYILLTVPFGKFVWQPYHQNYDWPGILNLTEGSNIVESYTYRLHEFEGEWRIDNPENMTDILYTHKAYGVGCFVLQKPM